MQLCNAMNIIPRVFTFYYLIISSYRWLNNSNFRLPTLKRSLLVEHLVQQDRCFTFAPSANPFTRTLNAIHQVKWRAICHLVRQLVAAPLNNNKIIM